MAKTAQKIVLYLVIVGTAVAWWQFGGAVLAVTLAGVALTALIFAAFALGSIWTHKSMQTAANLIIQSTTKNDEHDAMKMRALADVLNQALKFSQRQHQSPSYPPLTVIDAPDPARQQQMLPSQANAAFRFPIDGLVNDEDLGVETD